MTELERELRSLAVELEWPPTPRFSVPFEARRRFRPHPAWVALAALALAVGVAFGVPAARSAILRVFHLGGVTVEQVDVSPPARERPLEAGLGPRVSEAEAAAALGRRVRLPELQGTPRLHLRDGVVSVLLATPQPVLLSELRSQGFLLKKIAGSSTNVTWVTVGPGAAPGLWIAGGRHVLVPPAAPSRLAGNVLVWETGSITYRLEGRRLSRQTALRLAAEIEGT